MGGRLHDTPTEPRRAVRQHVLREDDETEADPRPPEYLRPDEFVYNTAQRSYQQLSTYVAGKYRAPKDVMALANRGSPGGSSRKGQTSTGPRGLPVSHLNSPWEEDDTDTHDMVAVLPSGTPGFRTVGAAPCPWRTAPTGPPLCYMCWSRGHRVPDCKILTEKQRDIVKAARSTFLRLRNTGLGATRIAPPSCPCCGTTCSAARSQRRRKGGGSRPWQPRPRGAVGRETPRGGGIAILLNPPCPPQLPGFSPSRHV